MGLIGNIKLALKLSAAWKRLKEEAKMGHGKAALFGLASAIVTGVVAKVTEVCPDLIAQWPALLTAAAMAGIGVYLKSPIQPPPSPKE